MRGLTAAAWLGILLAGCLTPAQPLSPTAQAAWRAPGVYVVDDEGYGKLASHPAIDWHARSGAPGVTIDFMQLMFPDRFAIVMVEFLGPATADEWTFKSDVSYARSPLTEGPQTADYCSVGLFIDHTEENAARFEAHMLERALGGPGNASLPPASTSGFVMGGDATNPLNTHWSLNFHTTGVVVNNGTRWLFIVGTSGVPQIGPGPEAQWYADIPLDAPARILLLPDADFGCGLDFARFDGVDKTAAPLRYAGGAWHVDALYGATVGLQGTTLGAALSPPRGAATVKLGNQSLNADGSTSVVASSSANQVAAIENSQWNGPETWVVAGVSSELLQDFIKLQRNIPMTSTLDGTRVDVTPHVARPPED